MTESDGNAGLPGTVKRESDIKQTRSALYHFMILSPKLFLVNKVWYVWENNLIHAYFRNKMTLSRDLKLQYLQKPSAQYTMTAKNWIIRQETEYQTGITTTLLYEAECLHLEFCRSDGPISRQAYERAIRINDTELTLCKRIMNKLRLYWKENEIMEKNMSPIEQWTGWRKWIRND